MDSNVGGISRSIAYDYVHAKSTISIPPAPARLLPVSDKPHMGYPKRAVSRHVVHTAAGGKAEVHEYHDHMQWFERPLGFGVA